MKTRHARKLRREIFRAECDAEEILWRSTGLSGLGRISFLVGSIWIYTARNPRLRADIAARAIARAVRKEAE